jgi:hypothetical protein
MSSQKSTRFPKSALKRYAEIILRHVYQSGGRERYIPVLEMEDTLGLEQELILELCRTRLLGEIQIADRLPDELESGIECQTPFERELARDWFSRPHVRIRPALVRLTADELLREGRKRKGSRKRGKSRS